MNVSVHKRFSNPIRPRVSVENVIGLFVDVTKLGARWYIPGVQHLSAKLVTILISR